MNYRNADHCWVRAPGRVCILIVLFVCSARPRRIRAREMDVPGSAPLTGDPRPPGLPVVKALFSCKAQTAAALSPVTTLALNMDQLAVLGR